MIEGRHDHLGMLEGESPVMKFRHGQYVVKVDGYPFPGIVEVGFMATQFDGSMVERYVVNFLQDGKPTGMMHIFNPEQLEAASLMKL